MNSLQGKTALVTGGGRGLGEAICAELASAGLTVIVADIHYDQAGAVATQLCERGLKASPLELDVRDEAAVESALHSALRQHGGLHVLVNNAGVDRTVPVEELAVEEWDRILDTNLRGPFLLTHHILPVMKAQSEGHILNIVSTAAKRAWPNASAYHASKWGLLGFSHALHSEARPHGVKVTAVICGGMRTPFLLERFPNIDLTCLQEPANVAETVRFVLSAPEGSVIPEIMVLPLRETSWP